jgi:uncharacterized protein YjbI with pentapeptide repeats
MSWSAAKITLGTAALVLAFATQLAAGEAELEKLRETRACPSCDLSGADLSGLNLMGGDLSGANLRGAILVGTRLADMTLGGADFSDADLTDAILNGSDARGSSFAGATLSGARLIETNFERADLSKADLRNTVMRSTTLSGAVLDGVDMSGASVEGWGAMDRALLCKTRDPDGVSLDRDCEQITAARKLMAAGFGGGRDLLRGPAPGVNPVAPGDGEQALVDYLAAKPWPRANTDEGVLQIQTMLRTLGYDPGPSDGYWGGKTRDALNAFLIERGVIGSDRPEDVHLDALRAAFDEKSWPYLPRVDWDWRATAINIGPAPVFGETSTIKHVPDFGFNTVSIGVICDGQPRDVGPDEPVGRWLGCRIGEVPVPEDQVMTGTSRNKLIRAIEEAQAAGLSVNVGAGFGEISIFQYDAGFIPADEFFYGNDRGFGGYVPIILRLAELAESHDVAYLTIGAEFANFNDRIERDPRWPEIIASIRERFSGKLIYHVNFPSEDNPLVRIAPDDLMSLVDILGVNVFPTELFGGRTDYTAEEIALTYERSRNRVTGANYMETVRRFVAHYGKPTILSEAHFPTWGGSADFPFRGDCDLESYGKTGWEYTKGPQRPKMPSDEAGRRLAEAYMLIFADEPWVTGINYLYWTTGAFYQSFNGEMKADVTDIDCGSLLYEKPNGIKELIREVHLPR